MPVINLAPKEGSRITAVLTYAKGLYALNLSGIGFSFTVDLDDAQIRELAAFLIEQIDSADS